ncbi:MAG: integron [Bradyrhizobiaceae bacterium PARB1]|nr:MAG: integron [Bradyrhizobiaceae bacterium PARB1]
MAITLLLPPAAVSRSAKIDVPVMIKSDPDIDACGNGEIIGLDPKGDGFLSVRSGPGGSPYTEIDRLYNGDQIYICGNKGPWQTIVYMPERVLSASCGVSKPWSTDQAYTGPCRAGWVHSRYVKATAG